MRRGDGASSAQPREHRLAIKRREEGKGEGGQELKHGGEFCAQNQMDGAAGAQPHKHRLGKEEGREKRREGGRNHASP